MASTLVLLLQLLLVSLASAGHYYGVTMTFSNKRKNPDGTFEVNIRNRATFDRCRSSYYYNCYGSKCTSNTIDEKGVIDRSANAPNSNKQWCETETVRKIKAPINEPFKIREYSCCWIHIRNWNLGFQYLASVDLGSRSDTGKPNRSPDIAILPLLRVPQNCPRTYKLMSFDPDGDKVRCRYGNINTGECSMCSKPSGFVLDQGSCLLHYKNSSADPNVYGFELVVEDFPKRHITLAYANGSTSARAPLTVRIKRDDPMFYLLTNTSPSTTSTPPTTPAPTTPGAPTTPPHTAFTTPPPSPLSKLPLQFSLLVDPPAPLCHEGLFLPKFVHPTPKNGAHIQAEVNKEVEIKVKAQASYAKIHDLIISGPLNISKHRTTHEEFVIRWTPIPDDLGDHYPICFAVESVTESAVTTVQAKTNYGHHSQPTVSSQSGIYQSEMRCVLVDVQEEKVKTNVICSESTMTVEFRKASFYGLHEDTLRLNDSSSAVCSLHTHSNITHIITVIPLNSCGTQIEEDGEHLIFKNVITTVDNTEDLISRKRSLELQFYCQYPKHGNITMGFTAHRESVTVQEKGLGTFTYQFEFYPNDQFQTMIEPSSYPVVYVLGTRIYMQIKATSSVNNTELFVESCTAAPYDNPNYKPTYPIIKNGCKMDSTVEMHSHPNDTQFWFSMEAINFIGLYDQVYITCSVLMCEAGNPKTRCSKGCMDSKSWTGGARRDRHKREAFTQTLRHFISQGPLLLRRSAESTGSPVINLNLNLVFIVGYLLAAVGQ